MERFPRGTLPPSAFRAVATLAPTAVARREPAPEEAAEEAAGARTGAPVDPPVEAVLAEPGPVECDLSTTCPSCGTEMHPEHAHYRCPACGYRDSCCF
jgi:hypothetical protein